MSKIPKDIKDLLFYIELQQKQAQTNKKFFKEGSQNYKHWENWQTIYSQMLSTISFYLNLKSEFNKKYGTKEEK